MSTRRSRLRRTRSLVILAASASTAAAFVPLVTQSATAASIAPGAAAPTATVFKVVSEGMTAQQGEELAKRADIPDALRADGSFGFRADDFATAPTKVVGEGRDEHGNPTTSEALDLDALKKITTLPAREARARAGELHLIDKPYGVRATIGNTTLTQVDVRGKQTLKQSLDTTVSYQLMLSGKPVLGPGAKTSVSLAGDGSVMQLTKATRAVEPAGRVPIITADEAQRQCVALYGGAEQNQPTLAYYSPALAADDASGSGAAQLVTPQYVCQPVDVAKDAVSGLTGRLVPAAPSLQPKVAAHADFDGRTMTAHADVDGGTAPYTYEWSSSSTSIQGGSDSSVSYTPTPRARLAETLSLTITDANGVSSVLSMTPSPRPGAPGSADAKGTAGGTGGSFSGVGIEQTVDEWACAQASADGFKQVMQSHAQPVDFDWRGLNAWERDFKDPSVSGNDSSYVDDVDMQWYTGHGNPNLFTFKNTAHDDSAITPSDASWGNKDLEWLNLESCQVLKDTNGSLDYFGRWGPTMNGLHLLNGFDTNAQCVGGGTGRRFAEYLFPYDFLFFHRPALRVSQAWASMAGDLEPSGTKWRSMSLIGPGGVTNLGDYYWGQGPVGPDQTYGHRIGMMSISGIA